MQLRKIELERNRWGGEHSGTSDRQWVNLGVQSKRVSGEAPSLPKPKSRILESLEVFERLASCGSHLEESEADEFDHQVGCLRVEPILLKRDVTNVAEV